MSIYLRPDVVVKNSQMEGEFAPRPLPLNNGFSEGKRYEVLGIHTASESAEAFLILRNDRDEMWFISNRHCRISSNEISMSPAELNAFRTSLSDQLEKVL